MIVMLELCLHISLRISILSWKQTYLPCKWRGSTYVDDIQHEGKELIVDVEFYLMSYFLECLSKHNYHIFVICRFISTFLAQIRQASLSYLVINLIIINKSPHFIHLLVYILIKIQYNLYYTLLGFLRQTLYRKNN